MEKNFETILERYAMPQGADWARVRYKFELNLPYKPSDKGAADEDREYNKALKMDSEALIRAIKIFDAGGAVEIKGAGDSVQIEDAVLKHFVLLSLHKLLQLRWALKPNEEELKEGKFELFALGSPDFVKVGIKKEIWGGFIEPYNDEELESLLMLSEGLKNYKKIRQGREGANVAYFGDCVAAVLGAIPQEVKDAKNKTDLLNFVGEVLEFEGILENEPHWKKATETLERHIKLGNYDLGADKKVRKQIIVNWLEGARRIYCQSTFPACKGNCKECENNGKCWKIENLKNYEI